MADKTQVQSLATGLTGAIPIVGPLLPVSSSRR
jgi:hypothetical protein